MSVLAILSAFVVSTTFGGNSTLADASRLVRAMQVDRGILLGLQIQFRRNQQGDASKKLAECLNSADTSFLVGIIADAIAKEMSIGEIRAATLFFESAVGKKYVQRDIIAAKKMLGFPTSSPPPDFSEEERAVVEDFSQTTAGEKLLRKRITDSDSVWRALMPKAEEIIRACAKSTEKS